MTEKDWVDGDESQNKMVKILCKFSEVLIRLFKHSSLSWKVANNPLENFLMLINVVKEDKVIGKGISSKIIEILSKFQKLLKIVKDQRFEVI